MAGSQIVPAENFPSNYEVVHVNLTNNESGDFADNQFVYYAHKEMVLDAAIVVFGTTDDDATLKLTTAASGTVAAGTDLTTATAITGTAGTPVSFAVDATANVIPAGNWIGVEITNTSTAEEVFVSLRLHSSDLSSTATSYGD